jgi:DNA-binding transcriptional LysR family regulator
MMIIRHLQYLTALARERHFGRAAQACNVTQPTLSAGIKQLEESLGVLIAERGQRFVGLTAEGERVLGWARRVLDGYAGLNQELGEMRAGLVGHLRLGAIPVTLPTVGLITTPFAAAHAGTNLVVTSLPSVEIQRGLDDFTLDAGLTYLDNEPLARVRALPLYRERYVLLTPAQGPFAGRRSVTWAEAATVPLCLLTQDMQNRRILDLAFRSAGAEARPQLETNSLITLWSSLRFGGWSTVLPSTFTLLLGGLDGVAALKLVEPEAAHSVGLVVSDRLPLPPVARALLDLARQLDFQRRVDRAMEGDMTPGGREILLAHARL